MFIILTYEAVKKLVVLAQILQHHFPADRRENGVVEEWLGSTMVLERAVIVGKLTCSEKIK